MPLLSLPKFVRNAVKNRAESIRRLQNRKSNTTMNLIKAHAIILVVSRHFGGGGIILPMNNWLLAYSYLIPLFTFVSGYFSKESYEDIPLYVYLKQRIRTLLLPYFKWNIIYGALTTALSMADIVHYGEKLTLHTLFVRPWLDAKQFQFMIPAWYLPILFFSSIALYGLRRLLKQLDLLNEYGLLMFSFLISLSSVILAQIGFNTGFSRTLVKAGFLLPYLQLGTIFKKHQDCFFRRRAVVTGACMIIVWLINCLTGDEISVSILHGAFNGNPIVIVVWSAISVLLTTIICEWLSPIFKNNRFIKAVGENSFSVMMHHPLVMFLINLLLWQLSTIMDMDFNVERFKSDICYGYPWRDNRIFLLYTLLGTAIPVLEKLNRDRLILKLDARLNS